MTEPEVSTIAIKNGNIYLTSEVYETYFKDIQSVVLISRDEKLFILPINQAGGSGLLLKIRNAKGDRIIHTQEQLREFDINETVEYPIPIRWDSQYSGLHLILPT
tara:strand:+ start:93 stop:407 length:315 start_codon:yes stop_codon:yes gene_type:complete